ncbi:hypothetical protein CHCC14596_3103 [Bacillus licheniformis]|nr:hypothetical protein CHCC15320_4187 [Bacillus licheniformis]TWM95739.1 hypothetical protein CHCC14596_3103 [Bacillus licheniformis]
MVDNDLFDLVFAVEQQPDRITGLHFNHLRIFAGHSDKAADRKKPDRINGLIFLKRKDFRTEADSKLPAQYSGSLSKDEMTKLMEKYERSKNKNKRDHSIHEHTTLCE